MNWRKIVLTGFGGPDRLEIRTAETLPEPEGGQVRVLATSAAFTDVLIRKGIYPDVKEKPPFTPGCDLVGVVDAAGREAMRFSPGERVSELTTIGARRSSAMLWGEGPSRGFRGAGPRRRIGRARPPITGTLAAWTRCA